VKPSVTTVDDDQLHDILIIILF